MPTRLIELHAQRGRLQERITHQRQTLAQQCEPLVAPLNLPGQLATLLDNGRAFVREHPYLVGTVALALVALKPRIVIRWARRGLLAWRTWRSLRGLTPTVVADLLRRSLG